MVHQSIWYHIVLGSLLWAASHMISYTQRGKCMAQSSGKALYNCVGSARLTGYYAHANFITLFMTPLTSANIPGSPRVYISRSGEPGNEARDLRRSWSFSKCSNLDSTAMFGRHLGRRLQSYHLHAPLEFKRSFYFVLCCPEQAHSSVQACSPHF